MSFNYSQGWLEEIVSENCLRAENTLNIKDKSLRHVYMPAAFILYGLTPLTMILNVLTVFTFYKYKKLHVASNILLCALACTDIFAAVFSMPLFATKAILMEYDVKICVVQLTCALVSTACSGLTFITAFLVTLDRYVAIFHPFAYSGRNNDRSLLLKVVVLLWIVVIVLTSVSIFFPEYILIRAVMMISSGLFIPFAVCTHTRALLLSRKIGIQVSNRETKIPNEIMQSRKATRAAKKTAVILGVTLVCYLPQIIVCVLRATLPKSNILTAVFVCTTTLAISNSFLNPLIYTWQLSWFRKGLLQLLKCPLRC